MPFELKVIAEPGSATQCGECPLIYDGSGRDRCRGFGLPLDVRTVGNADLVRLPQCIEAERRAKERA